MEPEEIARRWAKLSLSNDDGPIAMVDEGLKAEGIRRLSLSLVGKIVSNREVNREAFRNTIASIWRTKSEVEEIDGGDSGDCLGKFLRVRVLINVQQPLKRGLRFAFGVGGEVYSALLCYK
ncbi:hypothetical protein ACOSP7_013163 [Xanthoceras sorbifolium]